MRIAFVGCEKSLSDRKDFSDTAEGQWDAVWAYEGRSQFEPIQAAFSGTGHEVVALDWRQFDAQKDCYDLMIIGPVYNYPKHKNEFFEFLRCASEVSIVVNGPKIIEWNMHKKYLAQLQSEGYSVIPSMFLETTTTLGEVFQNLPETFEAFGTNEIVIKPVIGLSGSGVERYNRNTADLNTEVSPKFFIQPFVGSIQTSGERSLIFMNGQYSHALIKECAPGEFKVHAEYGGTTAPYTPSDPEIQVASAFVSALPEKPFLCRVDGVLHEGCFLLMEIDAIDRFLFPAHKPGFGEVMRDAILEFMAGRPSPNQFEPEGSILRVNQ